MMELKKWDYESICYVLLDGRRERNALWREEPASFFTGQAMALPAKAAPCSGLR